MVLFYQQLENLQWKLQSAFQKIVVFKVATDVPKLILISLFNFAAEQYDCYVS